MKLPTLRPKKYTDPLSVLQMETVEIMSDYYNDKLSDDELTVAIGEASDKAQESMREAIDRARAKEVSYVDGSKNPQDRSSRAATNLMADAVLRELGLEPEQPKGVE